MTAFNLQVSHAVLFTPDSGGLAGANFLVVDANGVAGYQAGADYVFQMVTSSNIHSLAVSDFV